MLPFGMVASHARYQIVDLSYPVQLAPMRIVVPWPSEESRLLAPIRPFQPMVCSIFFYFFFKHLD